MNLPDKEYKDWPLPDKIGFAIFSAIVIGLGTVLLSFVAIGIWLAFDIVSFYLDFYAKHRWPQ